MSRLHRRDALKLTATGVAVTTFAPGALAAPRATAPGPCTVMRGHRGRPRFFLDGQPYTKPVFETYVPETKCFRQFTGAGTDGFCFSTNLGPGFGTPTWLRPDRWDFSALDELSDYSPHAVRAFRDGLRAKYRVADVLQRAWNDPRAGFDSVGVPSQAAREAGRHERTFRDPATQMPVIDWYTTFESGFLQQTLQPAQVHPAKPGAPHDSILVDDLARADVRRYRLVIFLSCFHLTNPVLPAAMLRALAGQAGVHLYHRRDDTFYASRIDVCLNADGAGERRLPFPRAVDLFDPFTDLPLARRVARFDHTFEDKESLLIRSKT